MDSLTLGNDLASGLDVSDGEDVTLIIQGKASMADDGSLTVAVETAKKGDASDYTENEAAEPAQPDAAASDAGMDDGDMAGGGIPSPVQRLMKKGK